MTNVRFRFEDDIEGAIKDKLYKAHYADRKKFGRAGNITFDNIFDRISNPEVRCDNCNDKLITSGWRPHCYYQFTIDRLVDSSTAASYRNKTKCNLITGLPHDQENIMITCLHCNCFESWVSHGEMYEKRAKKICEGGCHLVERESPPNRKFIIEKLLHP